MPWFASGSRTSRHHEEDVSAEQSSSEANPRISRAHGDARGAQGLEAPAGQGAQAPHRFGPAEAAGVSGTSTFPKLARIRKRHEFLRVQSDGNRQHTEQFVVLKTAARHGTSRIGITVSTRVGNAVVRNRVKRLVREILRTVWRDLDPPLDVVVIAKPGAAQTTHAKASIQLKRALGLPDA